jgi:NAD(P)-dependent dehydrogenase (short-subunit alcohol dehydrogenase family)
MVELGDGVLVVTGGLSGIGAAAAVAAASEGWRVVVLDRALGAGTHSSARITVFPDPVDVTDDEAVALACEIIEARHGPILGLVNAAGILGKMHAPQRLALSDWDREIAVDLRGTFVTCREVGARMCARRHGAIVNVASVAGMLSAPVHGYAPAKAGVISLTGTLAAEWGPCGLRVNCVSPGFTETPALAKGLSVGALQREELVRSAALGRLVRPEEVAKAIVWLLSDEASGVTGINLPVDAGFIAGVAWRAYGGLRDRAEIAAGQTLPPDPSRSGP